MTRRRRRQRGGVTPAVLVGALLLAVVAQGAITIGRLAVIKQDAQRAADAGALAALEVIRARGLPFDAAARTAAEALAARNSPRGVTFTWDVVETPTAIEITTTAVIDVDMPTLVFAAATEEVRARGVGRLPQTRFDEAERRLPKLTLVLDYSGSMTLPFTGGSARAIDVLEDSVEGLLAAGLDIDYGAVFYSSDVFRTVPISAAAPNQIMTAMNTYDAGGGTNTAAGLIAGRNLLQAVPDTGRYILLVSDGEPNDFAAARSAAAAVWDAGMTIFTMEIRRSGSGAALARFMTDVAGTPGGRRDPNYHYVATTASDLVNEFRRIVASIVCKVGPLAPAPAGAADVRVYLRDAGGGERALAPSTDLAADRDLERFRYEPGDASIRLTARACEPVTAGTASIVVRHERPGLTR